MGDPLAWHAQLPTPVLRHSEGTVVIDLGGRMHTFASEAAARFFYEAYFAVPALTAEVAELRREIDEGALHAASARVRALEAEVAVLRALNADLATRNADEVALRTKVGARARVLARALRKMNE